MIIDKIINAFREYGSVHVTDYDGDVWSVVGFNMSAATADVFLRRGKQVMHCEVSDLTTSEDGALYINTRDDNQKFTKLEELAEGMIFELNAVKAQLGQMRCRFSIEENPDEDTGNLAYREHYKVSVKKPRNWG